MCPVKGRDNVLHMRFVDSPDRLLEHLRPGYLKEWVGDNVIPIRKVVKATVSDTLQAIFAQHAAWLNGQKGGKRADLSGWDLYMLDVNLSGLNLSRAILTGANLEHRNLQGAKLTGAKLTGANLNNADLSDADLSGADLRNARLVLANLRRSNLQNVNATKANFDGAAMIDADITGAKGREIEIAFNRGYFGSEKDIIWARRQLAMLRP